MLPYHLDNNVCPSSLHENETGELEPITEGETAHKWDDTEIPVTCSECGTQKDSDIHILPEPVNALDHSDEDCACSHCQDHPVCASRNGDECDCK